MAAEDFIRYYEQINPNDNICLKSFIQNHYAQVTPVKLVLNYGLNEHKLIKNAKECILSNLNLNNYFTTEFVKAKDLKSLYNLFKNTEKEANEDEIAQILLLLHFSKSKLYNLFFFQFFKQIHTIEIVTEFNQFYFYEQLMVFFQKIINNSFLISKIQEVISDTTGHQTLYNFEQTNLKYFKHDLDWLNGFAGINTIYLNIQNLSLFKLNEFHKCTNEEKLILLKMEFLRLITHEITHVGLRFEKQDFNMSTPEEKHKLAQKSLTSTYASNSFEAGALTEKRIFGDRINWLYSAEKNVDFDHCSKFLDIITKGEYMQFDIGKANIALSLNPIVTMAIDLNDSFFDLKMF